jgi:hypothetical protein
MHQSAHGWVHNHGIQKSHTRLHSCREGGSSTRRGAAWRRCACESTTRASRREAVRTCREGWDARCRGLPKLATHHSSHVVSGVMTKHTFCLVFAASLAMEIHGSGHDEDDTRRSGWQSINDEASQKQSHNTKAWPRPYVDVKFESETKTTSSNMSRKKIVNFRMLSTVRWQESLVRALGIGGQAHLSSEYMTTNVAERISCSYSFTIHHSYGRY